MGIKHKVNEQFFEKWNSEMAYVLGYWYADGNLLDASNYMRGKYVSVTSIDQNTIVKLKALLDSEHKIVKCPPTTIGGHERYLLRIGSHKLYESLIHRGLYPNKSLTIRFPEIPKRFLASFVRGYFDGDGCVYLERSVGKRHNLIIKRLRTIFTSGSEKFLLDLKKKMEDSLKLKKGKVFFSHRSFQLVYPTSESLPIFKFMYRSVHGPLFLERKLKKFLEYLKLRPQRVDKEIEHIIRCLQMATW
ncbi:MAG: LAGLIDADG family homing endonuclease [Patescibacteria group bacterium]